MKESASRISEAKSSSADRKRLARKICADEVDVGKFGGFDFGCIVTKVFTFRFIESSVGFLRVSVDLAPTYRQKNIAGICESRSEPADAGEEVEIFDSVHSNSGPSVWSSPLTESRISLISVGHSSQSTWMSFS